MNLLQQAYSASQSENWPLVNHCLQELLPSSTHKPLREDQTVNPQELLDLALSGLAWGDFRDRWEVAKLIPRLGPIAIEPLIEILQDEDINSEVRWFAARILGEFNCPQVVTALVDLLHANPAEDLSSVAATALAHLGPTAISALTDLLADPAMRPLAVRSLAQVQHSAIIAPLLSVVDDPEVTVRAAAIEALGRFHNPQVITALISALSDPAAQVRKGAVAALGCRADLLDTYDLVSLLQPLLRDLSLEVSHQAAQALGRLGTTTAADALFEVLQSPLTPETLQREIVQALVWSAHPTALGYLSQTLNSSATPALSQEIVTALARVHQPQQTATVAQILIDLLHSQHAAVQDPLIRQAIATGLGHFGLTSSIPILIELLADPDQGVQLHAIAALKQLAPEETYQQLQQLAQDDTLTPALARGVAIALQEW